MKKGKEGWKTSLHILIATVTLALGYAIIRYNIIKGISFANAPLFIANKGIALASVILIALSFALGPCAHFWPKTFVPKLYLRKHLGLLGFGFAGIHSIMSVLLFSPAYYPKFFTETGMLSLYGELSMLFGVLSFGVFSIVAITSLPSIEASLPQDAWLKLQRLGYLAFFFVLLHVFIMGFQGWLKPQDWPGGLLPISLIAFIIIFLTFFWRTCALVLRRKK